MNGCFNREMETADTWYWAQDGWEYQECPVTLRCTRLPVMVKVYHKMTVTCNYDKQSGKDCAGCKNIRVKNEASS